ncbi:nucleotidyltransferase family protein [Scytonema hofmannii FACHB-248]|uniref:Nucleotidyltransferase family protein n=1 Tax=Scytonema hofmannii FACHB-248 TaxID=1842502 RepID=A0ABR8GKB0_9CYAN|nr:MULTISPECIES: nucleotidyltransferase family protein [Nostocales]MBD2603500.1 nucleotidyltransferase family protein [Scytonema hofmannii FACHB-248]
MTILSVEVTVLLACVRFYLGTITKSEVTCLLTSDINWTTLLQTAIHNGVMPVLYQSLKAMEEDLVPRAVMVQLQTCNRMNGLHNFSQTKELLKILAEFEKAGIDAIAFKGPTLAASVYGNVTLRQFNDLDILVRQKDFWQAKAVLVAQGYQSSIPEAVEIEIFNRYLQISLSQSTPEVTMLNQRFQPSLLHSNPERSIDLHWGIPPRRIWKSERFERFWENLYLIDLMGQSIKTFSLETTLVIQCMNVAKEPWKRSFKQICDVGQIIRANPDLNWQSALELSSELRSQRLFLIGLGVTRKLLHVPLPQFMLEMLMRNQPSDESVFESDPLGESLCLRAPSGRLQVWWWEYTDQLKTLDQWWDGLFITAHYLQLLLKIGLSPSERDRELLPLPSGLFFLYYIIHPIRLLIKYLPWGKSFVMGNKP